MTNLDLPPLAKAQPITLDFFMSQTRLALVAVLAYGGGAKWFTPQEAGLYMTLFTALGPIAIPWAWSIMSNLGTIRISNKSAAAVVAKVEAVDAISAVAGAAKAVDANSLNPLAQTAIPVLALAVALSLWMPIDTAHAQVNLLPRAPAPQATLATKSFLDVIRNWVSSDIEGAISLATVIPELQDTTGATCWKTFRGIGDVITAHPLPVTLKLASDVQAARLVAMALKKVCIEPACAQVWLDMQNQVAALAPIGVPFTLNSICSKVL